MTGSLLPLNLSNLGISKCLGNGVIVIVLSKGYGQSFSNLKVLVSVPSLRAFFISSHSEFTGGVAGAPNPGAPSVGYVPEYEVWYGELWLPSGACGKMVCITGEADAMGC